MEKFCTTLGDILAELFGIILIFALIVGGVVCALVWFVLALIYKYSGVILLFCLARLLWPDVFVFS